MDKIIEKTHDLEIMGIVPSLLLMSNDTANEMLKGINFAYNGVKLSEAHFETINVNGNKIEIRRVSQSGICEVYGKERYNYGAKEN